MAAAPGVRARRVIIDSRERDHVAYPTPAEYELQLDDDMRDVVAMRLVVADVPFPAHLVGKPYTSVAVTSGALPGGSSVVATMSVGDYADASDVAAELQTALNAAVGQAGEFTVTAVARTGALQIRAQHAFSVAPQTRPLARVLGMQPPAAPVGAQPTSSPQPVALSSAVDASTPDPAYPYAATAPYKVDLTGDRYVIMHVRTPDGEVLCSTRDAVNRGFAVIPVRRDLANVHQGDAPMEKTWEGTPLARVSRVAVRFVDGEGNPYDFQNQDHRLELLFTCHVNGLRTYPFVGELHPPSHPSLMHRRLC